MANVQEIRTSLFDIHFGSSYLCNQENICSIVKSLEKLLGRMFVSPVYERHFGDSYCVLFSNDDSSLTCFAKTHAVGVMTLMIEQLLTEDNLIMANIEIFVETQLLKIFKVSVKRITIMGRSMKSITSSEACMSPQQQMGGMNRSPVQQMPGNSPQMCNSASSSPSYNQNMSTLIGKKLNTEPVETNVPKVTKKPKAQKKKKKRDPNEPQKPVSAYALFFRDTQAAIKGQSPNASFGEVSKIVASMWDSLDVDRKNKYTKKTETAKKEYLKALAAYRANLVSKAAVDQSDSMYGGGGAVNSSPPSTHSPNTSPPRMMGMQKQPVLTSVVDSMQPVTMNMHPQNQQQVWHMQSPQHTSPPHMMQSGNGMMNMQPHVQQMQQQPPMSPQQQQQMGGMNRSPVQQMPGNSPQMCNSASSSPSYNQNMSTVNSGGNHANINNLDMMSSLPTCLRNGCSNPAIDSPDWDREYCSSECVVSHCKDVFATWVAQRQVPANPYSTVK